MSQVVTVKKKQFLFGAFGHLNRLASFLRSYFQMNALAKNENTVNTVKPVTGPTLYCTLLLFFGASVNHFNGISRQPRAVSSK